MTRSAQTLVYLSFDIIIETGHRRMDDNKCEQGIPQSLPPLSYSIFHVTSEIANRNHCIFRCYLYLICFEHLLSRNTVDCERSWRLGGAHKFDCDVLYDFAGPLPNSLGRCCRCSWSQSDLYLHFFGLHRGVHWTGRDKTLLPTRDIKVFAKRWECEHNCNWSRCNWRYHHPRRKRRAHGRPSNMSKRKGDYQPTAM